MKESYKLKGKGIDQEVVVKSEAMVFLDLRNFTFAAEALFAIKK